MLKEKEIVSCAWSCSCCNLLPRTLIEILQDMTLSFPDLYVVYGADFLKLALRTVQDVVQKKYV